MGFFESPRRVNLSRLAPVKAFFLAEFRSGQDCLNFALVEKFVSNENGGFALLSKNMSRYCGPPVAICRPRQSPR